MGFQEKVKSGVQLLRGMWVKRRPLRFRFLLPTLSGGEEARTKVSPAVTAVGSRLPGFL